MWGIELNPAKVIDHNNHLNFFRLLFALQVVYSHSSEWLKIHEGREEDYTYDENNNLMYVQFYTRFLNKDEINYSYDQM